MRTSPGFSLIEANMAVVIAGIMGIALGALTLTASKAFMAVRVKSKANDLAVAAMEEIRCRKWDELAAPGATVPAMLGRDSGEPAGAKAAFDDIDDFNGYIESVPLYQDGTPKPGVKGFSIEVDTVCYVNQDLTLSASTSPLKMISVTVRKREGDTDAPKVRLRTVLVRQ